MPQEDRQSSCLRCCRRGRNRARFSEKRKASPHASSASQRLSFVAFIKIAENRPWLTWWTLSISRYVAIKQTSLNIDIVSSIFHHLRRIGNSDIVWEWQISQFDISLKELYFCNAWLDIHWSVVWISAVLLIWNTVGRYRGNSGIISEQISNYEIFI